MGGDRLPLVARVVGEMGLRGAATKQIDSAELTRRPNYGAGLSCHSAPRPSWVSARSVWLTPSSETAPARSLTPRAPNRSRCLSDPP